MGPQIILDLDDFSAFASVDTQDMIGEIERLPDQLASAWQLGQQFEAPDPTGVKQVIISGMGGSAIGADLVATYVLPSCNLPVIVHRDYDLPNWAQGPETLMIASSHSGNTEETLSSFQRALTRGCRVLAITTGGALEAEARQAGVPVWKFDHAGTPRAAVGFSFGLQLAALSRMGFVPDPTLDVNQAVAAMMTQQENLRTNVPVKQNLAKRLAGQLHGRIVAVFAADFLAPVARRWKGQISEVAKSWAQFEYLPEADHNTMAGLLHPEKALDQMIMIFLRATSDHPRNALRLDLTRKGFMQAGLNTDFVDAHGGAPLGQMWTTLHMGDYTAYYLAMSYGVDPTPVEAIEGLKAEMKNG
ncbi:MAG: bifunctional phosphoglucose/phosphomannose isomerase [Anaerolineaceae bacterium]|nr:bifunctional phosphoglucose/phosphomannose isomerase [Anaerolineaceae bacterium]